MFGKALLQKSAALLSARKAQSTGSCNRLFLSLLSIHSFSGKKITTKESNNYCVIAML